MSLFDQLCTGGRIKQQFRQILATINNFIPLYWNCIPLQCHLEMQFSMGKTLNKHFKTFQDIFTQKWRKKQKQCLRCGSLPNLTGGRLTRLPILGKSSELNRIYPEFLFVYLMWRFFIDIILMFFSGHLPDGLKFMFRSYLRKSEICLHIVWWKGFMIFEVSRLISVLSLVRKVVVSPSIYPHLAKSLLLAVSKGVKDLLKNIRQEI